MGMPKGNHVFHRMHIKCESMEIIPAQRMETVLTGIVSGAVQTIAGHPLDTMKVWKQNSQPISLCPKALYRGFAYPLVTGSVLTSIQFSTAAFARPWLTGTDSHAITHDPYVEFLAGSFSGIFMGLAISPIDRYKIAAQSLSCAPRYGLTTCLVREIPASGIYFGAYAWARAEDMSVLAAGAVAGVASWSLTYPLDLIKTRVQTGDVAGVREGMREMWAGKTRPFSGLTFCLIRAMLVNSVGFWVYEALV
jgi:solute carrier family 25 carnitine/acylcarnitine transporter 20/29